MNSLTKLAVGLIGVSLITSTACRSSSWQSADVAALQAQRRAKVEKSVGLKQSEAELQVARDAWKFGDSSACLSALDDILGREPGNVEALLLKAEVHLAQDEFIDADRSLAIALSHDPGNGTAKRLSEIARTKQLATRQETLQPQDGTPSPPLPAGAVCQAEYSPAEAGTAAIEDKGFDAIPTNFSSPVPMDPPASEQLFPAPEAGMAFAEDQPAFAQPSDSVPAEEWQTLPATGETLTWEMPEQTQISQPLPKSQESVEKAPEQLAALFQEPAEPSEPEFVVLTPEEGAAYESSDTPVGTAEVGEEAPEQIAALFQEPAEPSEPEFVVLTPEEGAAYESSGTPVGTAEVSDDASTGFAEVSDQSSTRRDYSLPADFLAAVKSDDAAGALNAIETDITDNPNDPRIPVLASIAALEANQPETAASIARLGIAFHSSSAALHRTLGAALYRSGNYGSSQVALQQALSLDNSSALAYFLMGSVSEKLGDAEAAQTHFAKAAELDPRLAERE